MRTVHSRRVNPVRNKHARPKKPAKPKKLLKVKKRCKALRSLNKRNSPSLR